MFEPDDSVVYNLIALHHANEESCSNVQTPKQVQESPSDKSLPKQSDEPKEDKKTTDMEDAAYNLYVTNEVFDQIISNANNVNESSDVYLSCQEVETEDGKMLMMASSNLNDEISSTIVEGNVPSDFKPPLDSNISNNERKSNEETAQLNSNEETFTFKHELEDGAVLGTLDESYLNGTFCSICDKHFDSSELFHQHYTSFHVPGETTELYCWECHRIFKKIATFIKHKINAHPEANNLCSICGELLATARSLNNHLKSHFSKQTYLCNTCGRSFRNQLSRQDHIRNKHLRSENSVYHCSLCNSKFQHGRSLVRHVKSVHCKQRVTCPTCNKSYSSISSLYYHQRTIHGNVVFHCGYCSQTFKSVTAVKKHENNMHQEANTVRVRNTPTEKIYHYNQLVCHDSETPKNVSVNSIVCLFCKAEYKNHEQYARHFTKFHKEESIDMKMNSDDTKCQSEIPQSSSSQ